MTTSVEDRLLFIESRLAIGQLPIRYAMAVDGRDLDGWVDLFVPDVQVGKSGSGRSALRQYIEPRLRGFGRSMHQIVGHRVDLEDPHSAVATGATYCRAEHEVGDRWVVMAICYFDDYRCVNGEWLFERRRERHWYAADVLERPQSVSFNSWHEDDPPRLPEEFPTWAEFWSDHG